MWILWTAWGSEKWPQTAGRIVAAEIDRHRGHMGITYAPLVTYRYSIASTEFTGTRMRFGQIASTLFWAEDQLARYRIGTSVSVYYDARRPSRAVLEPGAKWPQYVALAGGAIVMAFGLVALRGSM
jgi:hypothetical protein